MTHGSPRDVPGLSNPDPAASDGNSSVQVNVDSTSNRGRSLGRRSRSPSVRPSPSRGLEQSLARQATTNSLSSFLSSQPSSQQSQNDRPPPEDLLRGMMDGSDSISDAVSGTAHGVKRPHDDEPADEPLAKRDRLGEELDRLFAAHPAQVSNTVPSSSSALSTWATATSAPSANGIPTTGPGGPAVSTGTRDTLPIRASRRRPLQLVNGTTMSRSGIPEASEPATSVGDESDHSSNGQRT